MLWEPARAKINLFLHIVGKREDGYHDLESLMVFCDAKDMLAAEPAAELSLRVAGPFAASLPVGDDNIVMRAARMLRQRAGVPGGAVITLEKHLPVASGMGGGSADAAATLRLLARLWDIRVSLAEMIEMALELGSDVPTCIESRSSWVTGRGEHVKPVAAPKLHLVLVNPGVAVNTATIFQRLHVIHHNRHETLPEWADEQELIVWLRERNNDLAAASRMQEALIGETLELIEQQPGCSLARMSGSGATCFGIFPSAAVADAAASTIRAAHPGWWVTSTQTA